LKRKGRRKRRSKVSNKSCKGCINMEIKGKPWWSIEPHPCTRCVRRDIEEDNYTPVQVVKELSEEVKKK
jgi:hypothetical protein